MSLVTVVSFNYDNLLERAFEAIPKEKRGREVRTVVRFPGVEAWEDRQAKEVLPVFHVHGYLSPPEDFLKGTDKDIVFSHDEYARMLASGESWETSTPLHFLRAYCTLFIGSSLKDWNMLRLLEAALGGVPDAACYCLACDMDMVAGDEDPRVDDREVARIRMRLHASVLQALGVRLISTGREYASVSEVASRITSKLAGMTKAMEKRSGQAPKRASPPSAPTGK